MGADSCLRRETERKERGTSLHMNATRGVFLGTLVPLERKGVGQRDMAD